MSCWRREYPGTKNEKLASGRETEGMEKERESRMKLTLTNTQKKKRRGEKLSSFFLSLASLLFTGGRQERMTGRRRHETREGIDHRGKTRETRESETVSEAEAASGASKQL